jgi:hypothetical protein
LLIGSQPSALDNWISNGKKPAQICFQSERPHIIIKLNDIMGSTTAGVNECLQLSLEGRICWFKTITLRIKYGECHAAFS